jgi:hypothetical protein
MVDYVKSPSWIRDLIIYEVATRTFTSPTGPGGGTFRSMMDKLSYLHDLGVNGVWLTGHSLADPKHFYNIWTQYANIEPDKLDPVLGSEDDFKTLVSAAHEHGIRIFLDVIEHGVMEGSPLVGLKPHWFRGKSWGMVDYDFDLRDPEMDQWWVDLWTRYVLEFGVDGFRIDLGMRRTDLWGQVRENAARAGREIIFINELYDKGSKEFSEQSELTSLPPREEYLKLIDVIQRDEITVLSPHHRRGEINGEVGYATKWGLREWENWLDHVIERRERAEVPPWAYSSAQISSHDNGWDGFTEANPYTAQGSRFIFGYGCLFTGMIPIWMAGEEFNAPFQAHPDLSPNLFGGANPGQGTWLYGGVIQWEALNQPEHQAMLQDVKQMIALRQRYPDLLGTQPNTESIRMRRIPCQSNRPVPSPYMRWHSTQAVVVAGTFETDRGAELSLHITLNETGLTGRGELAVTDLWTGETRNASPEALAQWSMFIPPDKTPGGGVRLLLIEAVRS